VDATPKAKLPARLKVPKGSIGILAGIVCYVSLLSVAAFFEDMFSLLKSTPLGLLGFLAVSICTGTVVQHRVTRNVNRASFSPTLRGWLYRVRRLSLYARESNILLGIMVVLCVAYPVTMFSAASSIQTIVRDCKQDLDSQIQRYEDPGSPLSFSEPVCKCLSQAFLDKNGVVRLALFRSQLFDITDFYGVTEADEQACLNLVLEGHEQYALKRGVDARS
jgi:hypothetical protein